VPSLARVSQVTRTCVLGARTCVAVPLVFDVLARPSMGGHCATYPPAGARASRPVPVYGAGTPAGLRTPHEDVAGRVVPLYVSRAYAAT
jgi:hypothetical protein